MAFVTAFAAALAGFALFAAAHPRHRREHGRSVLTRRQIAARRVLAGLFLAASLGAAIFEYGPRFGPIAWVGLLTLSALVIAFGVTALGVHTSSDPRRHS
jgi:hypothetical protein